MERFGKDNDRIRYVCVCSGAAKYRANQLDIDPVLVSGTRGRRFKSSQARHSSFLARMTIRSKGFLYVG